MRHLFLRLTLFLILLLSVAQCKELTNLPKKHNVGLCVMATGRYDVYAERMVESARKFFCPNQNVTFFVFTDGTIKESSDVVKIYQKRLGWPHDTLKRFEVYDAHKELFHEMDYLFATDADMLFVDTVGDEILAERVATLHPGYYNNPNHGSYEKNKRSKAYIGQREGKCYFAGGFYGGSRNEFLKFMAEAKKRIDQDLSWNYIAVWHDESHLNRYFVDNPPTLILDPSYCYPEAWDLPFPKRLLALDKNHTEMRK
jgi:histo-blood group ABO system transferase